MQVGFRVAEAKGIELQSIIEFHRGEPAFVTGGQGISPLWMIPIPMLPIIAHIAGSPRIDKVPADQFADPECEDEQEKFRGDLFGRIARLERITRRNIRFFE
jgi:hypothetical protein